MKATDLRGILGYMARFRDRLFVLNIDSAVLAADNFRNLLLDISVLRSLNINVVIVHGASHRVRELATALNTTASDLDGMGVTDAPTLELAVLAANRFAHDLLEGLAETDVRAVVTNAVIAHPAGIRGGVDYAHTGKVERVDTAFLSALLREGVVPIVPPLGFDGNGQTFRVNSDQAARTVAESLKAAKLMFITTSNGIRGGGTLSAQFAVAEAEAYLQAHQQELSADMRSKLEHGLQACRNGVQRVHMIDGLQDEALLGELFSNEGVGTMIYANEYQSIRSARKRDVGAIMTLIRGGVAAEELISRTRAEVTEQLGNFYVFEIDRNVVACVGLHLYAAEECAELQCLFVAGAHENQGIGRKLVEFAGERALALGCKRLIALSTQAFNYFQQKGHFREGQVNDLPTARRHKYEESGRKSKILVRELTPETNRA
jgi:amino-acid N-acetyltransferase